MEEDKLGFLDEQQPEVTEEAEPAEPVIEESKGEPVAAPPAASEEHKSIPVTALLDERDKRKEAQRRAEELERRLAQLEQAQQPKPDFLDDPEAALRHQQESVRFQIWNERLNMSEMLARQAYGDDLVAQAQEAFGAAARDNPALQMELQRQRNPYDFVVKWHKRNSFISEVGDDPETWKNAQREALKAEILAELQAQQPVQQQPRIPGSLASAPAAGKSDPQSRGSAFDAAFPG